MKGEINIHWFRRDLRIDDNTALSHSLKSGPTQCLFIVDSNIVDELPQCDNRLAFIFAALRLLQKRLEASGSALDVRIGKPLEVWPQVLRDYQVKAVYFNRDYEVYAKNRDGAVTKLLRDNNVSVFDFKDHVVFDRQEVVKSDGSPYTVFTPYKRRWLEHLNEVGFTIWKMEPLLDGLHKSSSDRGLQLPLYEPVFTEEDVQPEIPKDRIAVYDVNRDFPAREGTTRLGVHLRFGTISIRQCVKAGLEGNAVFLSELIWRDFYAMILDHFPHVEHRSFRPQYDNIAWLNDESQFEAWKNGVTGYPMVDAGMRELNATGYMHNRLRMVTASFLTKHLLIDWRWGEAYFALKLMDYDLASNNGGWQWAAGCGTDAAPYFRIFNPESQQKKFDPKGLYIKKWIPEYGTKNYVPPIVDHQDARRRCLAVYKAALA